MNRLAIPTLCAFVIIWMTPNNAFPATIPLFDKRLTQLHAAEAPSRLPETARNARVENAYLALFSSAQTSQDRSALSDKDIATLFAAAQAAAFYSLKPIYVDYMQADLIDLQRRSQATDRQYELLFQRLIAIRHFQAASKLAKEHPGIELEKILPVQEMVPAHWRGPTELVIDQAAQTLIHRKIELGASAQIIVIAHPLCHFTQNAISDLGADATIGPILKSHAKWLAPPDGRLELSAFEKWNKAHPDFQMSIAYAKWPTIDDWSTPVFYFFKSGRLVEKVTGWPSGGHRDEIRKALQEIGLLK